MLNVYNGIKNQNFIVLLKKAELPIIIASKINSALTPNKTCPAN